MISVTFVAGDNLLISSEGQLKIGDFGLAIMVDSKVSTVFQYFIGVKSSLL